MKRLSRRHLLRGAAGIAVGLPFLEAMSDSARADVFPKRFLVWFTSFGQVKSAWLPTGSETNFTLGPVLSPLEAHKSDLLILEGVDMESAYHGPGDPHQTGISHALTGTEMQVGDLFPYACNANASVGWGGGISVDQYLASKIVDPIKFPSIEFGVQVQYANASSRMIYAGPGQPVPPEDDPWKNFDRIFGDMRLDPTELTKKRDKRHHVLDAVQGDYKALAKRLGKEDKFKVDNHLAALDKIAVQLDAPAAIGGECAAPYLGTPIDIYANDNYPAIANLQLDLLAMSLACDVTRIASVQWSTTQAGKVFSWLGQTETHHSLSHSGESDTAKQNQLVEIGNWHAAQLAYLISALKAIPEGNGSVFDNTLILWCTDIARGNTHARRDMPYVLAGGAGGYFKTGRYLKYAGDYHNNLLVSIVNAMGIPDVSFGNPAYCTGPLPGLTG